MEEQCGGTDGEKGPCPSVPGVVIEVPERWEHPKEALPDNLLYDLQGAPHPLEYLPSHGVQELMSQSSSHHKPQNRWPSAVRPSLGEKPHSPLGLQPPTCLRRAVKHVQEPSPAEILGREMLSG